MGQVSKVYNEGWFNCFASFANNGASTQCCQEVPSHDDLTRLSRVEIASLVAAGGGLDGRLVDIKRHHDRSLVRQRQQVLPCV